MNTSERTFKLQTELSTWVSKKKVAGWLAIVAVAILAVGLAMVLSRKEISVSAYTSALPLVCISLLLRSQAQKKISEIEAELSSL